MLKGTVHHTEALLLTTDTVAQTVLCPDLGDRPLVAAVDQAHSSSDGGAVLLNAADRRLGLMDRRAATLIARRAAPQVTHSVRDLLAQRVYGLACGHADANDADAVADDLSAAADVLPQTLPQAADHTALRHAQAARLRQALLTIGGRVVRSVRRGVRHLPRSHPDLTAWRLVAQHLGATYARTHARTDVATGEVSLVGHTAPSY